MRDETQLDEPSLQREGQTLWAGLLNPLLAAHLHVDLRDSM